MAKVYFTLIIFLTLLRTEMPKQSNLRAFFTQGKVQSLTQSTGTADDATASTSDHTDVTASEVLDHDQQQQQPQSACQRSVKQQKVKRSFQQSLAVNRPWLKFDATKNVMFCELCQKFDKKKRSNFVEGCSLLKLDSVVKHEVTDVHKLAVSADKSEKLKKSSAAPILIGFQKMPQFSPDVEWTKRNS